MHVSFVALIRDDKKLDAFRSFGISFRSLRSKSKNQEEEMENNMEEKNHIYPKTVGALHSGRGALYYSVLRFGEHDCDGDY